MRSFITIVLLLVAGVILSALQVIVLDVIQVDICLLIVLTIMIGHYKHVREFLFAKDTDQGLRAPETQDPATKNPNAILLQAIKEAADWPSTVSLQDKKTHTYAELQHKATVAINEKYKQ